MEASRPIAGAGGRIIRAIVKQRWISCLEIVDASNNSIIDGLANQQAASEEIAANAQSSADLCETNLNELNGVIDELNEIAKIIGSLRAADLEEINKMLDETTVQTVSRDTTDYSDYFSEDDGQEAELLRVHPQRKMTQRSPNPKRQNRRRQIQRKRQNRWRQIQRRCVGGNMRRF